jgi:hypothetical protein
MARGECYVAEQANFDQKTILAGLSANPANKDRVVGGYIDSTVKRVSSSSITLESTIPDSTKTTQTFTQTFSHIAPDVLVYDGSHKITMNDLRAGDHVSIKYRASGDALIHSETIAPEQVNPDEQVVVVIEKNSPDTTAAVDYQKYNGSEFEQVVPCKTQAEGYCTYAETQQPGSK